MPASITVALIVATAAGIAAWWAVHVARRRAEAQHVALRQDMQALVHSQSQALAAQLAQLTQSFSLQLGQMSQQVQTGVASAGTLASGAQQAVSERLQASTEMLGKIQQQLGEVSNAARQIESVLGGAKTRGLLGEVALERLLEEALGPSAYQMQYRFSTGEAVDAVVPLRDKLLPIDSKFPLEGYRRLIESGEDARKGFCSAVRSHAESVARKYILPDEGTLDLALMFVPSEGVYYEILRSDSNGTPLDEVCRSKGVVPVSPSTLFAHLRIICLGLRGMQIEENATRLLSSLTGLKKQMDNFGEQFEKIGTHLRNATQNYSDADRKLERARNTLDQMAQGAPAEKALEPAARD
jgi:DNA recombination protein RmuC